MQLIQMDCFDSQCTSHLSVLLILQHVLTLLVITGAPLRTGHQFIGRGNGLPAFFNSRFFLFI